MTDKKMKILLCAGVAGVAILMALALATCSGGKDPEPTVPAETQQMTEAPTQAPTEEPTEPTEVTEPTEPTEVTEPTEPEETKPSSSGSSKPGGYNPSFGKDDDDDEEETTKPTEPFNAPTAGVKENPYVEVLSEERTEISTVSLKAEESVYYEIHGAADLVLSMESADVTLTMGETVCQPDESGVITVAIGAEAEPLILQLTNSGEAQMNYQLCFVDLGSEKHPETLESIAEIPVELAEGDEDGYFYVWKATDNCKLTLQPGKTGYLINASHGGVTASNADSADGSLTLDIYSGMDLTLQVIAVQDEAGKYPQISDMITGTIPPKGSRDNPVELTSLTPDALELAGGEDHSRYYKWTAEQAGTFTIQVAGVEPETVICGVALNPEEESAAPETEETIETAALEEESPATTASVEVEEGQQVLILVETAADESGAYPAAKITFVCVFIPKPGQETNPIALNVPEDTMDVPASESVHYTAAAPGMELTITGENLSVRVGDTTYEPEEGEIVILCGEEETLLLVVTNLGTEDAMYEVTFVDPNAEPDSTEPDSTEPDSTEPDSTEPDSTEPDSTEPDSTEPDSTEPDSTEPDSTEPDSTEPDSTEPDSTEPDSTEPDSTEPDSTEPDSTEPDSTEPDSTEPDSAEPDSTEPKATEPKVTEPEETVPETKPETDATES